MALDLPRQIFTPTANARELSAQAHRTNKDFLNMLISVFKRKEYAARWTGQCGTKCLRDPKLQV